MLIKKFNQRGDTIIEVLISMAIIGLILGSGYIAANGSSTNVEDSEEHQTAITIAQTQLELVSAQSNPSSLFSSSNNQLCFYDSNGSYTPTTNSQDYSKYCSNYNNQPQHFTVTLTNPSNSPAPTYRANVSWPRLGGGQDNVQLVYQTYGQ